MFLDFLYNCEWNDIIAHLFHPFNFIAGTTEVSLQQVLQFLSEAISIPPKGFDVTPTITFDETTMYPMAATCIIQLMLPTCHKSYKVFEEYLLYGILNNGGFGMY